MYVPCVQQMQLQHKDLPTLWKPEQSKFQLLVLQYQNSAAHRSTKQLLDAFKISRIHC